MSERGAIVWENQRDGQRVANTEDLSSREDATGPHWAEVVPLLSNWPVSQGWRCQVCSEVSRGSPLRRCNDQWSPLLHQSNQIHPPPLSGVWSSTPYSLFYDEPQNIHLMSPFIHTSAPPPLPAPSFPLLFSDGRREPRFLALSLRTIPHAL